MVKNNKMLESLFNCAKKRGNCTGCIYSQEKTDTCVYDLMNDLLFFFKNPVPSEDARILTPEELEEALSDRKDHLAFCEYINSIHVAQPSIRSISKKGTTISLYDQATDTNNTFLLSEYYTTFRVWSTKPTDTLRNSTLWEAPIPTTDNSPIKRSKTNSILDFIQKMS